MLVCGSMALKHVKPSTDQTQLECFVSSNHWEHSVLCVIPLSNLTLQLLQNTAMKPELLF